VRAGAESSGSSDVDDRKVGERREVVILGHDGHLEGDGGGCDPGVVQGRPLTRENGAAQPLIDR